MLLHISILKYPISLYFHFVKLGVFFEKLCVIAISLRDTKKSQRTTESRFTCIIMNYNQLYFRQQDAELYSIIWTLLIHIYDRWCLIDYPRLLEILQSTALIQDDKTLGFSGNKSWLSLRRQRKLSQLFP